MRRPDMASLGQSSSRKSTATALATESSKKQTERRGVEELVEAQSQETASP